MKIELESNVTLESVKSNTTKKNEEKSKEKINLSSPGTAKNVARQILNDIDLYCKNTYDDGHRTHLGASLIGNECSRYLWYVFRWCFKSPFDGRMQRLFNRGHREEERFIEWLKGIGFKLWTDDLQNNRLMFHPESDCYFIQKSIENLDETLLDVSNEEKHIARAKADGVKFPQYRISDCNGHFGGSLDGIGKLPERFGIEEPVLLEFKTNGTGRAFTDLIEKGMILEKPLHFAQTSTYGFKFGFNYVCYLNICKNDDNLHAELVKLDHALGSQMISKAERIIFSQVAPSRLSDNPTFSRCKYCTCFKMCHENAFPEINCRSCKNAKPVENAEWFCEMYNSIIPKEAIKLGCKEHKPITRD